MPDIVATETVLQQVISEEQREAKALGRAIETVPDLSWATVHRTLAAVDSSIGKIGNADLPNAICENDDDGARHAFQNAGATSSWPVDLIPFHR